mmetsp:Transcript_50472/g.130070  ORF Transcript_50472/g.130070 Transcript_50472/m.130070 type:complete len:306 (+) Transcript_50472:1282-2199(+)
MLAAVMTSTDENSQAIAFSLLRNVLASNTCICWIKSLKYTAHVPYLNQLTLTLGKAATDILAFSILLLIVIFGFTVAFFVIFGYDVSAFRTHSTTIITLLRAMLSDINVVDELFEGTSDIGFGAVLFLLYCVLMVFFLLSMFVAIVSDTYIRVKEEEASKPADWDKLNPIKAIRDMIIRMKVVRAFKSGANNKVTPKNGDENDEGEVEKKEGKEKGEEEEAEKEETAGGEDIPLSHPDALAQPSRKKKKGGVVIGGEEVLSPPPRAEREAAAAVKNVSLIRMEKELIAVKALLRRAAISKKGKAE